MNNIKVTCCNDCPFCEYHYDDFAIGESELYFCGLLKHLKKDYFLERKKLTKIHTTCPLKQESVTIQL